MEHRRDVSVVIRCADWIEALPAAAKLSRRAALAALARGPEAAEASVMLCDDDTMAGLNRDYRGRDEATNVLAFAAADDPGAAQRPVVLGDVVVSYQTASAESGANGAAPGLADHLSHLIVHGMLHLLGYDHLTETDAHHMEAAETEILAGLGVADPHGDGLAPGPPEREMATSKSGRIGP